MKKFLILALACVSAWTLHAQVPQSIVIPKGTTFNVPTSTPDVPCNNFAGTFVLGATGVNTQSNDLALDTIWLCRGDSIFIDHVGDFNLSGDPQPATAPGIGYAIYECPPTITGPTLQHITGGALPPLPGDACVYNDSVPTNGLWVVSGTPDGNIWLTNNGNQQMALESYLQQLNGPQPLLVHFAPITFDDAANNGFEPATQGSAPGPCVNVNTAAQFEVVYLNPIAATGFQNPFAGNSCLGRFKLEGGYPEFAFIKNIDQNALYTVDIHLKSDPTVKAIINNPASQLKSNVSLVFSVPQAGIYVITVEDGKSCGLVTEVNMGSCTNADNVGFILPDVEAAPGETICLPITTSNFAGIQGFSTSIQWDPTLLQLQPGTFIQNINGDLVDFDPATNTETTLAADGYLGIAHIGAVAANLAANEVLMEVCFVVIGQEDSICTPITFTNQPSSVSVSNSSGALLAFEGINGEICILYDTLAVDIDTIPSPCNTPTVSYTLTMTGEEAPYQVTWQLQPAGAIANADNIPAGTPFSIPNLTPGTYIFEVTPQNGIDTANTYTFSLVVTLPESIGASLDLDALPSCNGENDGEVSVLVYQGTTPVSDLTGYTFSWITSGGGVITMPASAVQTNVTAGNYSVTVTQPGTGCTASAGGTLPNPAVLDNGTVTTTPATCTGVANGGISYEAEGGIPLTGGLYNFQVYYLDDCNNPNPTPPQIDNTQGNPYVNSNLLPGCYRIDITDANGCTFTDDFEITADRVVTLSQLSATPPTCFGGTDGELVAEVTSVPAAPTGSTVFFSWVPINGASSGTITAPTPTTTSNSGISAGSFLVSALDSDGCINTLTLTLGQPNELALSTLSAVDPTCVNPTAGAISVVALGGSGSPANFTYSWSNMQTGSSSISSLVEGTYTVTVTDVNGCTDTISNTISLPLPPEISDVTVVPVRCGSDGTLTVVAPTAVNYSWSSPTGNTIATPTTAAINNLSGGTYIVVVTDANFCTSSDTTMLANVDPLSFSDTTLTNPSCFGYSNGGIALGVIGGTPVYSYTWSVPQAPNSPVVPPLLPAGVYGVTVTDSQDCTLTGEFTLIDPAAIAVITTSSAPVSCFGVCDGAATLQVNNGLNSDFTFSWEDGGSTDSVRVDLCAGLTSVTITELSAAQCFTIHDVTITSPSPVTVDSTNTDITNVTCFEDEDGAVTIIPAGGNGAPYTYAWQQGGTNATITDLLAGSYVVTITDNNNCTGVYTAVVTQPNPIQISIDNVNSLPISCYGEDDGTLAVTALGGNIAPPGGTQYTYLWSDGTNTIGSTNPLPMLASGDYAVTVSDYLGCTGNTTITLFDPPAVQGTFELGAPLKCFGDETTISVSNITGGAGEPYTYTIDFGVPLPPTFTSSINGGDHNITYLDKKGCEFTEQFNVPSPDEIIISFPTITSPFEIELGDSTIISTTVAGALPGYSFEWTPADFFVNPTALSPTLYTFQSGQVMLTVVDTNGCTGKATLDIFVDADRNVYVPNAFSPDNREGRNDFFAPGVGIDVEKCNYMRVYDRWGELLYERKDFVPDNGLTSGWDGRFDGKLVEPGVYIYVIEIVFKDKKVLLYRGDVTVVR